MMPASTATLFQMDLQAVVAAAAKNSKLGKRRRKVWTFSCQLETAAQLSVWKDYRNVYAEFYI